MNRKTEVLCFQSQKRRRALLMKLPGSVCCVSAQWFLTLRNSSHVTRFNRGFCKSTTFIQKTTEMKGCFPPLWMGSRNKHGAPDDCKFQTIWSVCFCSEIKTTKVCYRSLARSRSCLANDKTAEIQPTSATPIHGLTSFTWVAWKKFVDRWQYPLMKSYSSHLVSPPKKKTKTN